MKHQIGRVVARVHQFAATTGGSGCAPTHVLRVEVVVEGVGDPNLVHGAENALIEQLSCCAHRRQEELVVSAHQGDAGCTDRLLYLVCLLNRQTERFLAQDVLSGLSSGHYGLGVQVVRQADVDGVEVCLEDHLPKVGVRRSVQLGRAPAGSLVDHIGYGGHLDQIGVGAVTPDMSVHDAATADEPNFDGAHAAPIGYGTVAPVAAAVLAVDTRRVSSTAR